MIFNNPTIESFPLSQAKNLKYLTLKLIGVLTDKSFVILMEQLKACENLKEVHFNLHHC